MSELRSTSGKSLERSSFKRQPSPQREIKLHTRRTRASTYVWETHTYDWPDILQYDAGLWTLYAHTHTHTHSIQPQGWVIIGWDWAWNGVILFTCPEPGLTDTHTNTQVGLSDRKAVDSEFNTDNWEPLAWGNGREGGRGVRIGKKGKGKKGKKRKGKARQG